MKITMLKSWFVTTWRVLSSQQRMAFTLLSAALLTSLLITTQLLSANAAVNTAASLVDQSQPAIQELETLKPQLSPEQRLAEHTASVQTLHGWLSKGSNTQAEAGMAMTMLEQLQKIAKASDSESLWPAYSGELALLEKAVEKRIIKTPEATALIGLLRTDYAELRDPSSVKPAATTTQPQNAAPVPQASTSGWAKALLPSLLLTLASALWLFYVSGQQLIAQTRVQPKAAGSHADQKAILQLLDEMGPLAEGDLRVQATVTEAMTGALADSFNLAVSELRWLVGAINQSAGHVTASVTKTRDSANKLAQASSVQAREIHRSSNYLNVMSDTMAQLSAHAAESSNISSNSVKQAQVGSMAVDASVQGLVNIREQAQMTSRMMQRLVESSSAIKKHVNEVQRVAKNTDLLALNTTIRAAAATGGEQTDELSRLSTEVTQLASTLRQATREIAHLAGIIQQDAALTLTSVQKTNSELDAGHQKAIQASQSLKSIESVSTELQNQIDDIASKTLRQAGVVRQLSANMGVINGITRESSIGLQDAANDLQDLQNMATELLQSVAGFSLPDQSRRRSVKSAVAQKIKSAVQVDHRSQQLDANQNASTTSESDW